MDKKTTDKGWAAMREMLDREMPERQRRGIVWWWLALLLLPLAGYGSWQWLGSEGSLETQPKAAIQPVLAENHAAALSTTTSPVVETTVETASTSSNTRQARMGNQTPNGQSLLEIASPKAEPLGRTFASESALTNSKEPETEAATTMPPVAIWDLASLPISAPGLLNTASTAMPPLNSLPVADLTKPVKKAPYSRWALGATSTISTEQFNSINGFSTGLTIDWNFARKWGLRTGAFFNIHTPQEKYRPVASVLSAAYRSNVKGDVIVVDAITGVEVFNVAGNNYYGDSLSGNVFIPVNRMQRLDLPVNIFWQAAPKIKILGGLAVTRTLSAKADKQNYSGDYILKLANRTAEDGASRLSSTELDNWSADAMFALGWKVGKSFELSLAARMPLSKIPGLVKRQDQNTNAGLSALQLESTKKQNSSVFSMSGTLYF